MVRMTSSGFLFLCFQKQPEFDWFRFGQFAKKQKKRPYNLSSVEMSLRKLLLSRNCWPCNKTPIAHLFHVPFVSCAFINWIVWFFTVFDEEIGEKWGKFVFFIEFLVRCQFLSYLQKKWLHFDQSSYTMYKLFLLANFAFIQFLFKLWCFRS